MSRVVTVSQANDTLIVRNAKVVFEPSSYDQTEGAKKTILFAIDENTIDTIQSWETRIDKARLSSAISQFGLRAKCGDPHVWAEEQPTELPGSLRNRTVNAVNALNGIWHTKKQDGLCLHVTDIEFLDEPKPTYPF